MDTDFIERIEKLKLTVEEGEEITIRSTQREKILEEWSLSLIGKFLGSRTFNQRAAKNLLRSVWKMGNDLKIVDIGEGLYQFKFSIESQMKWVLDNGPWSFENQLLVLRRWEIGMTPRSVKFTTVPMWVQVWGLPFDLINEDAGRDIGSGLGRVVDVDSKALSADQARFLRIRVEVPLSKPLRRGSPVISPKGDKALVAFRYERLVGLCYRCGTLGHDEKFCIVSSESVVGENPYREWMKAGYRGGQGNMGRRPQGFQQQNDKNGRADRGRGPAQGAANSNSNSGVMIIYENAEKSGINDEANNIPSVLEATSTETELMMVDPTIKDSVLDEGNRVSFEAANQGINLYNVPLNYGTNSIPFGTETNAKQSTAGPRDSPHPETLPMHANGLINQKATRKKGLRKSEAAKQEEGSVDKKTGLKREHRAWEDVSEPEKTECKKARIEMQMDKTINPTVEAGCQPRRSQ